MLEELSPAESPLDFFNPDYKEYSLAYDANMLTATAEKGGCLYVPAFYWMQSRTLSRESTLMNFEYESHSELTNLLFEAIDKGILED